MGRSSEAENTYVLREIESKLNPEDTHKWLESMGDAVVIRRVEDIVKWLERQTNVRRILNAKYNTP